MKSGNLKFLEPSGPIQACDGSALLFTDTSSICKKELYDLTLITTMVARFAGRGFLIITYSVIRNKIIASSRISAIIFNKLLFLYLKKMNFKVSFTEVYPRIPWELTVPKGSAEHFGNTWPSSLRMSCFFWNVLNYVFHEPTWLCTRNVILYVVVASCALYFSFMP
jgi:hypothetical protein